jgi:hypothetical protein
MHFTAGQSKATNASSHDEASRSFTRPVPAKHPLNHPLLNGPEGLMQRKCACGGTPGVDDKCAECRGKSLQGQSAGWIESSVPPMSDVRSHSTHGPPESSPVALTDAHFGHDFSRIAVFAKASTSIQAREPANTPGDAYEQEADRTADQVVRGPRVQPQHAGKKEGGEHLQPELIQAREAGGFSAPPIVDEVSRSPGQPLDPPTRAFMEPRFGRDFGHVRVHTDQRAIEAAKQIDARAFTHGTDIAFGTGEYAPNTAQGRYLIAHELTHVVQQAEQNVVGKVQRAPQPALAGAETEEVRAETAEVAEVSAEMPAAEKTNAELVQGIVGDLLAILTGWDVALHNFETVLTSASAKSAKPNFQRVVQEFIYNTLISETISKSPIKAPGVGKALDLLNSLAAELERAATAKQSATLRDFITDHRNSIGQLRQIVESSTDDFLARVRRTETAGGAEANDMRVHLIDLLGRLDSRRKDSTPQNLFTWLSEEWIRQSTLSEALGTETPAYIVIRIEGGPPNFSVRDAEIKGPNGQNIAEQLLRQSQGAGVDVFDMRVPRRILYFERGKQYYSAIVRLDEDNNVVNEGSFIEGNWGPIYRALMSTGLPPTKNLTGD